MKNKKDEKFIFYAINSTHALISSHFKNKALFMVSTDGHHPLSTPHLRILIQSLKKGHFCDFKPRSDDGLY